MGDLWDIEPQAREYYERFGPPDGEEDTVSFLERVALENAEISAARRALNPRQDELEETWPDEPTIHEEEGTR